MEYAACKLIGYIFGCINPAYYIAKMLGYGDIRKVGSGNAGASNAGMLCGKWVGIYVAVHDVLKSLFASLLAGALFPTIHYARIVGGTWAVIGHVFPINLKFKGGKGLASFCGMILVASFPIAIFSMITALIVALITDYLVYGVVTLAILFPACLLLLGSMAPMMIILPVSLILVYRHRENFERIKKKLEYKVSYIWDKEARIAFKEYFREHQKGVFDESIENKLIR